MPPSDMFKRVNSTGNLALIPIGSTLTHSGTFALSLSAHNLTRHQQARLWRAEKEFSASFEGHWTVGVISGSKIIWRLGGETNLLFTSHSKVEMPMNGAVAMGTLETDGSLYWDDGNVWTRVEAPRDTHQDTAMTLARPAVPHRQPSLAPSAPIARKTLIPVNGTARQSFDDRSIPSALDKAVQRQTPWPDIRGMSSVKKLSLVREGIGPLEFHALPLVLRHTPYLTALDLSCNQLGPEWVKHLAAAVLATCNELEQTELASLELNSCSISDLSNVKKVFEYTNNTGSSGLKTLHLGANKLGATAMMDLAAAAKETPKLTSLVLDRNPLGPRGAFALTSVLRLTRELKVLRLGECRLGPDGAAELSEGLLHTKELVELSLPCNRVGPEGAHALSYALKLCTSLTTLDMSWNNLGQDGLNSVAAGLQNCRKLSRLLLQGNGLDPGAEREVMVGVRHIASGLINPPRF